MTQFCTLQAETSCSNRSLTHLTVKHFSVGMSSVTLKIGLFHLLVTDCLMCYVVIVDRYKCRWLRRNSLHICNKLLKENIFINLRSASLKMLRFRDKD